MNNDLMSTMKWKELAEIEAYLDLPMDQWETAASKAKLAFAMQYLMAKRNNPGLTIDDAESLTISQLSELSGLDVTVPKEVTSA
jgi:hypothetical protein